MAEILVGSRIGAVSGPSRALPHGIAIAVLISVLACACASPLPPPDDSSMTNEERWRQELPSVLASASDFQAAILEDGEVSAAEHAHARRAYLDCLERSGLQDVHVDRYDNGLIRSISFGGGSDADAMARNEDLHAECEEEFYVYVAQAWASLVNADDTEQALLARMAECLSDRGYEVPPSPATIVELREAVHPRIDGIRDLGRCGEEVRFADEGAPDSSR